MPFYEDINNLQWTYNKKAYFFKKKKKKEIVNLHGIQNTNKSKQQRTWSNPIHQCRH